jgi:hypothetical protein
MRKNLFLGVGGFYLQYETDEPRTLEAQYKIN